LGVKYLKEAAHYWEQLELYNQYCPGAIKV